MTTNHDYLQSILTSVVDIQRALENPIRATNPEINTILRQLDNEVAEARDAIGQLDDVE